MTVTEPMTPEQVSTLAAPVAAYLEQRAAEIAQLDIRAAEQRATKAEKAAEEATHFAAQRVTDLQEEQARQLAARDAQVQRLRNLVERERGFTAKIAAEGNVLTARVSELEHEIEALTAETDEQIRTLTAERDRHLEHLRIAHPAHFTPNVLGERSCGCGGQWPCPAETAERDRLAGQVQRVQALRARWERQVADPSRFPAGAVRAHAAALYAAHLPDLVLALDGGGGHA